MLFKIVATSIAATGLAFTGFMTGNQTVEQSSQRDCCEPDRSAECCVLDLPCCDDGQDCCETGESCCVEQLACCSDSALKTETVAATANACCTPDRSAECCVLDLPCCDGDQDCCQTGGECCDLNLACCDS
ncbi:hypothetical protein [Thalassoroseus pseudoceratinae]|uniref:hypothetical protein n=1 Tax=Thalassoroseus pseudoceratinae TaxID=2713176 RepID=UPI00141FAB69|nr:hypothetical protein [Thalassoroseus pseudoceratinae]